MSDILAEICGKKRKHIAECKAVRPLAQLEKAAKKADPPRGFIAALEAKRASGQYGIIAEIKKASPSKGIIRADFQPVEIAKAYEAGGAACLSVLTDIPYFQGADAYLTLAREGTSLPVLRKDFMLDPYQVVEARALGADCILLIMAALSDDQARELEQVALGLGMDVLAEVHDMAELKRAAALSTSLIGINNRNLKTLKVDINVTAELSRVVPDGKILVAESGLYTRKDLDFIAESGVTCFLIGESLMRQNDLKAAVSNLLQ